MIRRGAGIDLAPNSLFRPDNAELLPCCRDLIPCSVAQGTHSQYTEFAEVFETNFAENGRIDEIRCFFPC